MYKLTALYIYPIKSLGGIALNESPAQPRGLQYDRRWMLVDATGRFVSQREIAELALLGTALEPPFLTVFSKKKPTLRIQIPLEPEVSEMPELAVQIWGDQCLARVHAPEINQWFSGILGQPLRLVFMADSTRRMADEQYAAANTPVSFADGFPFLIIGQATLDDLNSRLEQPLPMNRFRPNFVFEGGRPYEEDNWTDVHVGNVQFKAVKACARCSIPTIDQDTAEHAAEPIKTLATYRQRDRKILFGQNLTLLGEGTVQVGSKLNVFSDAL